MRGSPLLRALLAFLAILSLGYPLWRLTRADEASAVEAGPVALPTAREIALHLTFSTRPSKLRLLHLGKEVWSAAPPAAEVNHKLSLAYPREGIDLQFQVEFPEGAPLAAMRVQLTDPAGNEREKSLWGTGTIDDVLTFP